MFSISSGISGNFNAAYKLLYHVLIAIFLFWKVVNEFFFPL
jgi:hypothetical protein